MQRALCSGKARLGLLVGLLVSSEAIYLALLRLNAVNGIRSVLFFLALMAALFALYAVAYWVVRGARKHEREIILLIAAGAVLFRLTLLPAGLPPDANPGSIADHLWNDVRGTSVAYERFLLFDSDIWRYLWDGHVLAHGVNPYMHPPADPALDPLADQEEAGVTDGRAVWSDVRDNINHPSTRTIYPPLAQTVFWLAHALAPGSVLVMKTLIVGFDLLAMLFVALTLAALGRPVNSVILYAWNPLVIKVFAGSGHVDAAAAATLAATVYFLARQQKAVAGVSFGLGILAKLSPVVLLPFVARRIGWRWSALAVAVVLSGYIPFRGSGWLLFDGFRTFAREWQFNAGPFAFFQWVAGWFSFDPTFAARVFGVLAVVAVVGWLAWRDDGQDRALAGYAVWALGALIILSPTVMPWYVASLLPLAIVADRLVWVHFSGLVCLSFLVMINGTEPAWVLLVEYAVFAGLLWRESHRTNTRLILDTPVLVRTHRVLSKHSALVRSSPAQFWQSE